MEERNDSKDRSRRCSVRSRSRRIHVCRIRCSPRGAGDGGKPAGIACQQAGISTLQSLGLLSAVAKGGIEVVGVGTVPFKDVLTLHRTMPELFQTGGVTVVVPGVGDVPATWCNV